MSNRTKEYLFKPFSYFHLPFRISEVLWAMNPQFDEEHDEIKVYVCDDNLKSSNEYDSILYVIVDGKCKRLNLLMKQLNKKNKFYIDSYIAGTVDQPKVVIRFNYVLKKSMARFLNSEYSKIYTKTNKKKNIGKDTFWKSYMYKEKEDGSKEPSRYWHTLMHTKEGFKEYILPLTSGLDKEELRQIWENEFDDKLNLKNEVFRYDPEKRKQPTE